MNFVESVEIKCKLLCVCEPEDMKSSDFRKNYQEILDTLPLPWKYLQKSPRKHQSDGYDSDSSVHEMPSSAISNVTARRVRVRRGSKILCEMWFAINAWMLLIKLIHIYSKIFLKIIP